MTNVRKYPSPVDFLIKAPLYEEVTFSKEDLDEGLNVRYFTETFDSYCPYCNAHSIFKPTRRLPTVATMKNDIWVNCGFFETEVACSRNYDHKLTFNFLVKSKTIQKVGQYPSIADLSLFDVKKYSKVLKQHYFREFTKSIGLASHGVGVGSFVYLRRIFEFLIEEAHTTSASKPGWEEETYCRSRMAEKIDLLRDELPAFLVENKSIYSILSKGIHELSEQECLDSYPAIKVGIEIILDEKLEKLEKEKKLSEAKNAIAKINSGH